MGGGGGSQNVPGSQPLPVAPFAQGYLPAQNPFQTAQPQPSSAKGGTPMQGLPSLQALFNQPQGSPMFPNSASFPQMFLDRILNPGGGGSMAATGTSTAPATPAGREGSDARNGPGQEPKVESR